jgi:transmembrane sensor
VDLETRLQEGPLKIRDVWSAEQTAALSGRVLRLRRRRSLVRFAIGLGAVMCTLVLGVVWSRDAASSAPIERAQAPAITLPALPRVPEAIVLRDGSRAELADAASLLTVSRDVPEQVRVVLERGGARFAVARRAERRFEVEAGPVLVRVRGTTFSVRREGESTRVAVEDGHVQVLWAGETMDLFAGDSSVFPPPAPAARSTDSTAQPAAATTAWRELAKRGEYKRAYTALQKARARVPDAPEDHMLAADVARLSGHAQQAVPHLRAVAERFADDPRAPVAAFTLGRVFLDLERPSEAAQAFRRARTLWPRGPLALDAWASEAEALHAAGDRRAAEKVATRYIERQPAGRHAQAMRALAGD